jgi:hypothetical protein
MKCPRCGDKISDNSTYCESYGEIITEAARKSIELEITLSILIILGVLLFIYHGPKLSTYYLKKDIVIEDNTTKYNFKYLDEIQVIKDKKKDNWDVYIDNGKVKIGTVNKAILFDKKSEEYTKAKEEFERQKTEEEKAENIARQQKEKLAQEEYEAKVKNKNKWRNKKGKQTLQK